MSRKLIRSEGVSEPASGRRAPERPSMPSSGAGYYYLETLGCPKNRVDAEGIARMLVQAGYAGTSDPAQADVLIVNTCGFIEAARTESVGTLRELAARKRPGQLLIAAGCLSQRWGLELANVVPALNGILGTRRWLDILRLLKEMERGGQRPVLIGESRDRKDDSPLVPTQRVAIQGSSAYLKVAEGCSAPCAFCAIPAIKGPARSRPWPDIVADAEQLMCQGVLEIILIAQDTTAYGWDQGNRDGLPMLIRRILARVPHLHWLRILYAYPQHISPDLIEVMASHSQVCHYLDLPLQHAHPQVLRRMQRPTDMDAVRFLIADLRCAMPDIALRTSFIVGYPGETAEEFRTLLDFVAEIQFDRVGVFTYSQEDGTPAAELMGQLPKVVKQERYHQVMGLQQEISLAHNRRLVGQRLEILVEGCNEGLSVGRSYRDAPEIDGLVLVEHELPMGKIVPVRITEALDYDLVAVVDTGVTPDCIP
jgi:ribosomal protein S12 methylthiotransferase